MRGRLRIFFGAEDLARIHVCAGPDPMWETVLSMHILQTQRGPIVFDEWRRQRRQRLGSSARLLLALNPAFGAFPDFLTPASGVTDLDAGLDMMLSTPRSQLCAELSALDLPPGTDSWARAVAGNDVEALHELGRLFRGYHRSAVRPVWESVVTEVGAERQRLAQAFLRGGPAAVLSGLSRCLGGGWRQPVLDIDYPVRRDLHLNGRGLLLVPSYFCWKNAVTLVDAALVPVLVYPAPRTRLPVRPKGDQPLSTLIGTTRAAVLRALETPHSTTALAQRAGTSIPSASRHASVLRDAGLIVTERHDGAVLHSLTELGIALLRG